MKLEKMNFTENHLVSIFMVSFETHFVGMTGFEPATTRTPCVYATRLRHIPKMDCKNINFTELEDVF